LGKLIQLKAAKPTLPLVKETMPSSVKVKNRRLLNRVTEQGGDRGSIGRLSSDRVFIDDRGPKKKKRSWAPHPKRHSNTHEELAQ